MRHLGPRQRRLGALALISTLPLTACSDDDDPSGRTDGGLDGSLGGAAGSSPGGNGGFGAGGAAGAGAAGTTGGTGAAAGTGAASGAGGTEPDAGAIDGSVEGGPPDAPTCLEPDAGDGAVAGARLVVVDTDFFSTSELITVDVDGRRIVGRADVADGDVAVRVSDGRAFVLERTTGHVSELTPDGAIEKRIPLSGDAGLAANPHAIAVVPGTDKAYVTLYDGNSIAIVDLASGSVTGSIDLGDLLTGDDADGSVDADGAVYDPTTGYVYVTLQRVDRTTVTMATDYRLICRSAPSVLVAVDPATDTLVGAAGAGDGGTEDAGGSDAGGGPWTVGLGLVGPQQIVLENDRLLLVSNGCFDVADGGYTRRSHGVEAVALPSGTTTTLLDPPDDDLYNGLLYFSPSSTLVVHFDSSFVTHYTTWDPASPSLGSDVTGVPEAPSVESDGSLLGIANGALVRVQTATAAAETVVTPACLGDLEFVGGTTLWR